MTYEEKIGKLNQVKTIISCYDYLLRMEPHNSKYSAELKKAKNDLKSLENQNISAQI